MKRFQTIAFVLIGCILLFNSCDTEIQGDFLGPIVNGVATIEDLSDLRDKSFTEEIPILEVGNQFQPGVTIPAVPPFEEARVGAFIDTISEYFREVAVDSGSILIELANNPYPFPIGAGTVMKFRRNSQVNDDNVIFSHIIQRDIPPGGSYTVDTLIQNTFIRDSIWFFFEPFKSPGGSNITTDSDPNDDLLIINFTIRFLSVRRVEIRTNKDILVSDTTEVNIFEETTPNSSGILTAFVTNSLPVNTNFQLYVYDENMVFLDSMFTDTVPFIPGGLTDANGDPLEINESDFDILLTQDRIETFKSARYAAPRFYLHTIDPRYTGEVVVANKNTFFQLRIVGDLNIGFQLDDIFGSGD